jgi:CDP-glucose 4,6-dehydratase
LEQRQGSVESLVMAQFADLYRDRRVLVTGDSGFKGSWLLQWLHMLGAKTCGLALAPHTSPNHFDLLQLPSKTFRGDIRDFGWLEQSLNEADPEIIFHLAAQPLVRHSYKQPLETYSTNVMGTANLLQASRRLSSLRAIVVITTDKVYHNNEWAWGYRENDRLGGYDPYSASKACSEIVVNSFRQSFFTESSPLIASVRAGNVIGGGDWSEDRLVPDFIRSATSGQQLEIRSPNATRPWQHVLECLCGYLMIGQRLLQGQASCATEWNIGPEPSDNRRVVEVLELMSRYWSKLTWRITSTVQPHEANLLYLDSSKAKSSLLGWKPIWNLDLALDHTVQWYKGFYESGAIATRSQIESYVAAARKLNASWVN